MEWIILAIIIIVLVSDHSVGGLSPGRYHVVYQGKGQDTTEFIYKGLYLVAADKDRSYISCMKFDSAGKSVGWLTKNYRLVKA